MSARGRGTLPIRDEAETLRGTPEDPCAGRFFEAIDEEIRGVGEIWLTPLGHLRWEASGEAPTAGPSGVGAGTVDSDWREAAKRLVDLKINQMFRETPAETFWSLALYEGVNHERLLPPGIWSWTNTLSLNCNVVFIGDFDESGVYVANDNPRPRYDNLGFRVSRSNLD